MFARGSISLIALFALALTSGMVSAEEQTYVDRRLAQMEDKLDLTDEQFLQVREILETAAYRIAADRQQLEGDPDALRSAVAGTLKDASKQIEALLTEDQREEYVEFRKSGRADLRTMELQHRLALSEAQTAEVYEILLAAEREFVKMRDEMMQNGGRGRGGGGMSKMRDLRKDTDEKIEKVLTEEQRVEYEKIQDERRSRMQQQMGSRGGRRGGRP
jgi:Spy/CpxP family protein refolding chaperone